MLEKAALNELPDPDWRRTLAQPGQGLVGKERMVGVQGLDESEDQEVEMRKKYRTLRVCTNI